MDEAESRNGLHVAAGFGFRGLAKQLLESGECDVNATTEMGATALIEAAASGQQSVVRMLLDKKADMTVKNWYGTALHCAAESGQVASIIELLSSGLDVDIKDRGGRTALHCATTQNHVRAMQALLDRGANVDALSDRGYTSLRLAVMWERPLKVVQTLLTNGADTEELQGNIGFTVLHHAAGMNLEQILTLLISYGADVCARYTHGGTALHLGAERNHISIVKILLQYGAEVEAQTDDGMTALHSAAQYGSEGTVQLLRDSGANMEATDEQGFTPLHIAAREDHENVVRVLLSSRAEVNALNKDGESALDLAFECGCSDSARHLLRYGAVRKPGPQQYWLIDNEGEGEEGEDECTELTSPRFNLSLPSLAEYSERCEECNEQVKRACELRLAVFFGFHSECS